MANGRRKRAATRRINVAPITVWGALNQPVAEISEEVAKGIFMAAAVIMLAIWVAPYWGSVNANSTNVYANTANGGTVAGVQTEITGTPEWYYVAQSVPSDVADAFGQAASEVLDISNPFSQIAEFYQPGAQAVWDAWLELMVDPY